MFDPVFAKAPNADPLTRIVFAVDEATSAEMAGASQGRPAPESAEIRYTSPGRSGQAWRATPAIDPAYGRLEASLVGPTGPWTNIGAGGSLADPSAAGTARTLWVRFVAHRWQTTANPDLAFELALTAAGMAGIADD